MTTTLQQAIIDVQAGKYVEIDIAMAYDVICQTQSLGNEWNVFLENAPSVILHTQFAPCISINEIREYVVHELSMPTHDDETAPLPERVKAIFDSAAIFLQRYDIEIPGTTGSIFINRTPTEFNFDRARVIIMFVLEIFGQVARGIKFTASNQIPEVTVTIRGMEKFYDINILFGINDEAWVGFDFR
jgi:hypothetical protein